MSKDRAENLNRLIFFQMIHDTVVRDYVLCYNEF